MPVECSQESFFVNLGERINDVRIEDRLNLENLMVESSAGIADRPAGFALWFGVTTGKRKWLEQEDACCALVERLAEKHENLTVYIDGWTSSMHGEGVDLYAEDQEIFDRIYKRISSLCAVVSLVGKSAHYKVSVAGFIDFFVANHSTGSMWVSGVCACFGVTHISNSARDRALAAHSNPKAVLIEKDFVVDCKSDQGKNPFHVSYSITVDSFVSFVMGVLQG